MWNDEQEAFQDFLELTLTDFRLRYRPDFESMAELNKAIRKLRNDPPLLDRKVEAGKKRVSHIRLMRGKDKEIFIRDLQQQFRNKGVNENGIASYMVALRQATKKKGDTIEIGSFLYKGNPLTTKVFDETELDVSRLDHKNFIRIEVLNEVINELEIQRPDNANIAILREYVESLDKSAPIEEGTKEEVNYFPDLAVGSFDLELTHRRRTIYTYWENVAAEYQKVIDASKAIITEYNSSKGEGYEELDDDMNRENSKSFYSTFKELVTSVDNPSGKHNYVVELKGKDIIVSDMHNGRIHNLVRIWFDRIEQIGLSFEGGADYSKDAEGDVNISGWAKDEGATPEQIRQFESQAAELVRRTREEKRGAQTLMKTKIHVDPLLAYLVRNNKIEIGAYSKFESDEEIEMGIKRAIRRIKYIMTEVDDESVVDVLEDYIDKIKQRASDAVEDEDYYLPITAQVLREFKDQFSKDVERKNTLELHRNFLKSVNTLVQPDAEGDRTMHPLEQSYQRTETKPNAMQGKTAYPEPIGHTPGQEGKLREHKGKMKGLIKRLIRAIDKYYIDPSNSQNYPFYREEQDELFSDFEVSQLKRTLEVHWGKPSKDNWKAMSVMARQYNRHATGFVTYSQMKDIVSWLKGIKGYDGKNINRLVRKAINAYEALEEITTLKGIGKTLTQENKIYFAYYIDLMARKNGNDVTDLKFPEYGGSLVSELASQYNDDFEEYPMKALKKTLGHKQGTFKKTDIEGSNMSARKRAIMLEYFALTKVTKSAVEINILDAHDTIRKIGGKPTYFAFGDTSDFDDVNNTIDIVKKSHNVELMPIEVENIVNDFNSHRELSKKYGLSEEVIYRVKAMYR